MPLAKATPSSQPQLAPKPRIDETPSRPARLKDAGLPLGLWAAHSRPRNPAERPLAQRVISSGIEQAFPPAEKKRRGTQCSRVWAELLLSSLSHAASAGRKRAQWMITAQAIVSNTSATQPNQELFESPASSTTCVGRDVKPSGACWNSSLQLGAILRNFGDNVRFFSKPSLTKPNCDNPHCKHQKHLSSTRLACMNSCRMIASRKTRSCPLVTRCVLCNTSNCKSVWSTMHRDGNICQRQNLLPLPEHGALVPQLFSWKSERASRHDSSSNNSLPPLPTLRPCFLLPVHSVVSPCTHGLSFLICDWWLPRHTSHP